MLPQLSHRAGTFRQIKGLEATAIGSWFRTNFPAMPVYAQCRAPLLAPRQDDDNQNAQAWVAMLVSVINAAGGDIVVLPDELANAVERKLEVVIKRMPCGALVFNTTGK